MSYNRSKEIAAAWQKAREYAQANGLPLSKKMLKIGWEMHKSGAVIVSKETEDATPVIEGPSFVV